ncbi:MAG: lipoyl domain-containing protein [Planctomyces sp.]|nr:lipoyl domain-containing protein [Planctomyces sp.]
MTDDDAPPPAAVELRMPDIGAAGQPIRLVQWLADRGAMVIEGDRLIEVVASGVLFHIAAPRTGVLAEHRLANDAFVEPGDLLGVIEPADAGDVEP